MSRSETRGRYPRSHEWSLSVPLASRVKQRDGVASLTYLKKGPKTFVTIGWKAILKIVYMNLEIIRFINYTIHKRNFK